MHAGLHLPSFLGIAHCSLPSVLVHGVCMSLVHHMQGVSHGLWTSSAAAWLDSFKQGPCTEFCACQGCLFCRRFTRPSCARHLSSEGLTGAASGRALDEVMWAVQLSRSMLSTAVHVGLSDRHLSCCSWMSRRMSWQQQHIAKHVTPSGSLRSACGSTLRQPATLARQ